MRILVDENIPRMTVRILHEMGYDVRDIRGTTDQGMPDRLLWEQVQKDAQMLITTDRGFAQHRDEFHQGILIIRLRQPNRNKIHQRIMQAMAQFSEEEWPGLLVVMRDTVQSIWRREMN